MPQTEPAYGLSLSLPEHVYQTLNTWASFELDAEPEEVLEALAEELCQNEELRAYVAGLVGD